MDKTAEQPSMIASMNAMTTSFRLEDDQVDALIENGRTLLRADPEFQKLLKDLADS